MLLEAQDESQIRKWYNEFNIILFNNELPHNIPFKFNRSKKYAAQVNSVVLKRTINGRAEYDYDSVVIKHISFSKLHIKTDEAFKGILVHEMIHIWLLSHNIPFTSGGDKSHGIEFMDKLKEVQAKVSFKIPLTEEVDNLKVEDTGKTFYVAYIKRASGNSICVYAMRFFLNNIEELKFKWNYQVGRGGITEILLGTSKTPELAVYPTKRSTKLISYKLPEKIDNNMKNMNVMYTLRDEK